MTLQIFHVVSLFILLLYISLIIYYWYFWRKTKEDKIQLKSYDNFISVVIVGRNEGENLLNCINSIMANDYPKELFEIIYIDDFSTDHSLGVLKNIKSDNFRFYKLEKFIGNKRINNYKKIAIKHAISLANGDVILQTDADTLVGDKWLLSHASKYVNDEINFVTGPVLIKSEKFWVEQFQKYDFLATMGVTCAGISSKIHYMANGANMSYRKKVFHSNNNEFASGDDMFLVQNIAQLYSGSVSFLKSKESIVFTYPEKSIADLFRQRIRWATKTKAYKSMSMKLVVAIVFLVNLIILLNIVSIFFYDKDQVYFTVLLVLSKLIVDSILTKSVASFFKEKVSLLDMIASLLRYPLYIVTVGLISLFKSKYQWKSREVK